MNNNPNQTDLEESKQENISPDESEKVELHVLESSEQTEVENSAKWSPEWFKKNQLQVAFIATLIIWFGFVGIYFLRNQTQPKADGKPAEVKQNVPNKLNLLTPETDKIIEGATIDFAWEQVSGADSYIIFITNQNGDVVFQGQSAQPKFSYQLASPSKKTGTVEVNYFWYVQAKAGDSKISESERRKFIFKS